MPDSVELNIEKVLAGSPLEHGESAICDYTLEEQNASLEIQGVQPSISPNFKPILKETVTYVVAVLVINDQNEVLMIQEAKESCAGKWYLPAGRVDKNETLYDAAIREVLEETGLIVECTTLLNVECAKGFWVRFSYMGHVTGGKLKTISEADEESLQAKWIGDLNEVTLRADDILPLIERASMYILACLRYVHSNIEEFPRNSCRHSYNTRNRTALETPYHRLTSSQRFVDHWGPAFYNKIPENIRVLRGTRFDVVVRGALLKFAIYNLDEFFDCDILWN